ncbi:hypothetical protein [Poseidonibacter lekithochrous]|uniref:hypothetical protein n=1 Tax=Poseidonibacter lekithochrous TaxID=1904463 RepID=UPI0008FC3ABF|nr:hypothetical protein [Poseidonibacter lekithochrous]QKJ22905.1 hypothetical protein ALEK_1635 [Poseidonibacter lekithochrous]
MVRVDRKFFINILFFLVMIIFTGCSTSLYEQSSEKEYTSTREYKDISKDAIFEAAKRVFLISAYGEGKFLLDSYRNNLFVTKSRVSYNLFSSALYEDNWDLNIKEIDNVSKVRLTLKRTTNLNEKESVFLDKKTHNIFWDRVDYLLGYKDEWNSCNKTFVYQKADFIYQKLHFRACQEVGFTDNLKPNQYDIIRNKLISQRIPAKSIPSIADDILKDDIVLTVDDADTDILEKEDDIKNVTVEETAGLDALDKEIEKLDKLVTDNIDETLKKIEKNKE